MDLKLNEEEKSYMWIFILIIVLIFGFAAYMSYLYPPQYYYPQVPIQSGEGRPYTEPINPIMPPLSPPGM